MELSEAAVVAVAVLVGATVQGSVGFGLALVAAPVLALVDPDLVPATPLLLATGLVAVVAWRERSIIELGDLTWAWIGRVPGTLAGVVVVSVLTGAALELAFGLGVLAAVAMIASGRRVVAGRGALFAAGGVSGLMATSVSIGGPPMALVLLDLEPRRMRATMAAFFLGGSALSLAALAVAGRVHLDALGAAAWLTPAMLIGLAVADPLLARVSPAVLRRAALTVAAVSATVLVVRGLA